MSFSRFGKISYVSETKVADFIKYLEQGKIMATRCRRCGKIYFPPRADCPDDLSTDMMWKELTRRFKLLSYTTAYFAPSGFEDDLPYTLALAIDEEDVKVYALLDKDIDENEIHIGMNLRLMPLQLSNERITYELKKA